MITITRLEQEQMNIGLEGIIFTLSEQDSILHMGLIKNKTKRQNKKYFARNIVEKERHR